MKNISIKEVQNIILDLQRWAEDDTWEFWRAIILSVATILEKIIEQPDGE